MTDNGVLGKPKGVLSSKELHASLRGQIVANVRTSSSSFHHAPSFPCFLFVRIIVFLFPLAPSVKRPLGVAVEGAHECELGGGEALPGARQGRDAPARHLRQGRGTIQTGRQPCLSIWEERVFRWLVNIRNEMLCLTVDNFTKFSVESVQRLVILTSVHSPSPTSYTRSPARPARVLGAGRAPEEPRQAARAGAPGHARVRQGGGPSAARRVRLEA